MDKNIFKKALVVGIVLLMGASGSTIAVTKQIDIKNNNETNPAAKINAALIDFNFTIYGECYYQTLFPGDKFTLLISFGSSDTTVDPIAHIYFEGFAKKPIEINQSFPFNFVIFGIFKLNTNLKVGNNPNGGYIESPFAFYLAGDI